MGQLQLYDSKRLKCFLQKKLSKFGTPDPLTFDIAVAAVVQPAGITFKSDATFIKADKKTHRTHSIRPRSVYSFFHFFACGLFEKAFYLVNNIYFLMILIATKSTNFLLTNIS